MTLHTSQYLLSVILEQRLQLPTLSWSLTAYPFPCYVEVPHGLTFEEASLIQDETNTLVFKGQRVHVEVEELDSKPPGSPNWRMGGLWERLSHLTTLAA
jgi:misacylated tRNA(Ala) deacylase